MGRGGWESLDHPHPRLVVATHDGIIFAITGSRYLLGMPLFGGKYLYQFSLIAKLMGLPRPRNVYLVLTSVFHLFLLIGSRN